MVIKIVIALAVLAIAYGLFRWRAAKIEQRKRLLRQERRMEQEEAWDAMLEENRATALAQQG